LGTGVAIIFEMALIRSISGLVKAAQAVGRGDLQYRAGIGTGDEIGQLAMAFNEMTERRKQAEEEREKLILQLQESLSKVKVLSGMLPICSSCKKIRDDKGYWSQIESYIRDHSDAEFSHGICPDCAKKLYPEYSKDVFPPES
jgi:HAMP domain-containing protein